MMQKETNMIDISVARLVHLKWVLMLEAGVKKDRIPILDGHKDCELGRWIHTHGLKRYGEYPEMLALAKRHKVFHESAAEMARMHEEKNFIGTDMMLEEIKRDSRDLIYLLTAIEYRIINRNALEELIHNPIKTLRGFLFGD